MDEYMLSELLARVERLEKENAWFQHKVAELEEKLESETGRLFEKLNAVQQEARPPWKRARAS